MQVISLIALMAPQLLTLVLLVMAQLVGIAIAIILFFLMATEGFSLSRLVASLSLPFAPLMVTKIIIEVAAAVKPILRRSD